MRPQLKVGDVLDSSNYCRVLSEFITPKKQEEFIYMLIYTKMKLTFSGAQRQCYISSSRSPSTAFSFFFFQQHHIKDELRVVSFNQAYIEYSQGKTIKASFISTSELIVTIYTLDPCCFTRGCQRFRAFKLLQSWDLINWFPVLASAVLFCHICGRANST